MPNVASQADLWYNKPINIVLPPRCCKHLEAWINLYWRSIMDTLPPHALNGKPSPHVPTASGIYKITCTANKRFYIGSAVNLHVRRYDHYNTLKRNVHKNPHLQRAFNKYGIEAFTFEVLELVLIPEMLTAREQYWFDKLKPFGRRGYNIAPIAGSNLGKHHTPETREKLRQIHLGSKMPPEAVEKSRQANLGRRLTPEQLKNRIGRKPSPENLEKMRIARSTPEAQAKLRATRNTPEYREKQRLAQSGKTPSPETREKLRQKGLGKKMSPESREKMKQSWIIRKAKKEGS